ncbi:hypothetical protein FA13DRAFT_1638308 [Coprinellus micaceus]|uniref:S-adenosyl-L-methionine-dependent methyltransferase n=1 Tax=Coprinellus micaceus TaxID=71717 RepID=A0A4Y7SU14_COPMI|nr:hypothetical protein FA13DRAFT_1638308 [Coprinellus micaceus]
MLEGSLPSSYTSYDRDSRHSRRSSSEDSRSASPASLISLSESIRERLFREEHGRHMNNYSEVYRLPADEEEWARLDQQHYTLKEIMGAKYPPEMKAIMENSVERERQVLDLGCGSGAWATDVGLDWPLCRIVGVDLVPLSRYVGFDLLVSAFSVIPASHRIEVNDINMGLQHFYNQFDVVHARLISSGIKDYKSLIDQISCILVPGGLVELVECDFHTYNRHRQRIKVDLDLPPNGRYWPRYMAHINAAAKAFGGDVGAATHLYRWLTTHGAFEDISYRDVWIPTIPGDDTGMYRESVYCMIKANVVGFLRSGKLLLRQHDISEEEVDAMEQFSLYELSEEEEPVYIRLQCIWATKCQVS